MTKQEIRLAGFVPRLKEIMDKKGHPKRGRAIFLADITGVSIPAAHKWLRGEALPSHTEKGPLHLLTDELNTTADYLLFGPKNKKGERDER